MSRMNMRAVLLIGTLTTSVASMDRAGARHEYVGTCGSVTESECNIELILRENQEAQIVETCRLENGTHEDASETTQGTWSIEGDQLTVAYDNQKDVLEYDPELSYRDFGSQGGGPGLKLLEPVGSGSRILGFGHLWKRPLE